MRSQGAVDVFLASSRGGEQAWQGRIWDACGEGFFKELRYAQVGDSLVVGHDIETSVAPLPAFAMRIVAEPGAFG